MKINLILLSLLTFFAYNSSAIAATHKIIMNAMDFNPSHLTVNVGDKVIWVNKDISTHSASAKAFNSGSVRRKKSWSYIATIPGEHPYRCVFHAGMKGLLTVTP